MSASKIINPFGNDTSSLQRVQSWVDPNTLNQIRSVCPTRGVDGCAVACVYKGLENVIKSLNLSYTPENASRFADFILTLPTVIQAAGERHYSDVKDGTGPARPTAKTTKNLPADNGKGSPRGRGNR